MSRPRPDDQAVVFLFRFGQDGGSMVVTMADAERVLDTASKTRLCRRDPELVLEVFMENCGAAPEASPRSAWMNKGEFDASIRDLVPARWIPEADKQRLSQVLSAIFYAFEEQPGQGVCVAEIVGGLSLLCAGNKSSKLAFSFHLFAVDNNEGGCLTPSLLGSFLGSFATVLCACTEEGMEMKPEVLRSVIAAASNTAVSSMMSTLESTDEITFEDVGNWYNTGGFEVIPWLELLDLRKWAATTGLEGPSAPGVDGTSGDEAEPEEVEAAERGTDTSGVEDNVAFQFSLGPSKTAVLLTVSEEDVSNVLELAQGTGLANRDPADVAASLISASENSGVARAPKPVPRGDDAAAVAAAEAAAAINRRAGTLTKESFDRCIRTLVPGRRLSQGQKERFSGLLSAVFFSFDFDGSGIVDVRDLTSGFFLLCAGNKSVKLASAFRLLDTEGQGRLTRDGVWRFLRSLLSILMGFSSACQAKEQHEVVAEVDTVAAWTSNQIFQTPRLAAKPYLSFDELASWYTGEGYKVAPWLELLDLNKWAIGATPPAGTNGRSQRQAALNGIPNVLRSSSTDKQPVMPPPRQPLIAEPKPPAVPPAASANGKSRASAESEQSQRSAPNLAASASAGGNGAGAGGGGGGQAINAAATGKGAAVAKAGAGVNGASPAPAGAGGGAVENDERGNDEANAVVGRNGGPDGSENGEAEFGSDGPSQMLFTFPLVPDVELLVMQEDVDFVQRIVVGTRLAALLPQDILDTFRDRSTPNARGKEVSKAAFDEGMQELVRLESMLEDERDLLSFALANIFFAYDRAQDGRVLLRDLACGLSFLCCGSKSSKLAFAFSLFAGGEGRGKGRGAVTDGAAAIKGAGSEEEGEVSRQAIGAFVSGLLTVLCSCVGQMLELTNREMWAIVDRSAEFTLEAVFEDKDSQFRGRTGLTFEEFGVWYNEGGFKSVPWMELVDLSKWVPGVGALRPAIEGTVSSGGSELERKPRFCFQISESSNPVHLVISDDDARAVLDLVQKTGLCDREPADVCGALMSTAKDGVLSKQAFDKCIRGMVPASRLGTEEKAAFSVLLSSIFFSFDRDNSSSADAVELASGFSLLCAGSKSAKLAFAFGLHDEDGDERLTRRGLWRYTRSFLTALMALSFASSSLSAEELTRAVDDGAVWTAAAIFAETTTATPNRIGFDEFAAWYTEGGFRVSPWLELLDMAKWAVPAAGTAVTPSE